MTTLSYTGPAAIGTATDVWFRSIKPFADSLTTLGFVQTSDTGQINWTTVTTPATATYTNYEIWRFNDAAQATDPVFMKIYYTRITISSVQYHAIRIEFGTGSDGAGALTGPLLTVGGSAAPAGPYIDYIFADSTATKTDWYTSSDGSGFALMSGGYTTARLWLLVERARDADGDILPTQLICAKNSGPVAQASSHVNTISIDMTTKKLISVYGISLGYVTGLGTATSSLAVLPSLEYPFAVLAFPTNDGKGYSKLMVGYAYGDFLTGTEFDLERFTDDEVVHYRCIKPSVGTYCFGPMDTGSSLTASSNASAYGVPALYWQ